MNSEWWKKLEAAYHTARELSGEERSRFLDAACAGDDVMRRQIDVLLGQDESPDSFLKTRVTESFNDAALKPLIAGTLLGSYRAIRG